MQTDNVATAIADEVRDLVNIASEAANPLRRLPF
jgi:hypothetical protein